MYISPSRLAYTKACPKFRPSPFTSDAAEEGIALHSHMEKLATLPPDQWDGYVDTINPAVSGHVRTAVERLLPIVSLSPAPHASNAAVRLADASAVQEPGLYPEVQIELDRNRYGYIDLLINQGYGNYVIVDYKFVRSIGDYDLQLAAYACALKRCIPDAGTIRSVVIAPMLDEGEAEALSIVFDSKLLDGFSETIKSIGEAADSPNTNGHPGPQCEHCKWSGKCRYQASGAADYGAALAVAPIPSIAAIVKPETLDARAQRRDFIRAFEALIESAKADDKEFFAAHPDAELPGYKVTMMPGRTSLDKDSAASINRDLIATLSPHISAADLLDVAVPDAKRLAQTLQDRTGMGDREAKKAIDEILLPYMKAGAPYPVLRKTARASRDTKTLQESSETKGILK